MFRMGLRSEKNIRLIRGGLFEFALHFLRSHLYISMLLGMWLRHFNNFWYYFEGFYKEKELDVKVN